MTTYELDFTILLLVLLMCGFDETNDENCKKSHVDSQFSDSFRQMTTSPLYQREEDRFQVQLCERVIV